MISRICSLLKIKSPESNRGYLLASGTTVPSSADGYQTGCIFQKTDGSTGTSFYINEGSVTSSNFQAVSGITAAQETLLGATAGSVGASQCIIVDARKAVKFGAFAAGGASTGAVAFTTAFDSYSDGQLDILSVFGASTADLTSAYSAKCGRFRHIATSSSGTFSHETYGVIGQMVVKGTTLTHLHSGVIGTFEGHTSGVVCNSSYTIGHAAVTARVGGQATITATTPLAGFLAFNNGSAAIASGKLVAYGASSASASYPWQFGIYFPRGSVYQGIRIGDWVGSGATGSAIAFSTAQNFYSDGQLNLVQVFSESASDLTSAYAASAGRFRHLASGSSTTIAHETYGLQGQMIAKSVTLTHLNAGLMGTFEANTTAVVCNSSYTIGQACVMARLGGHALITATKPICGFLAFNNASAAIASGKLVAYGASSNSASYPWQFGIYFPVGSVYQGIRIGDWVGSGATGSAIAFSTSQNFYSDGQLNIVQAFGESSADLTSAYAASVGRFRHLVSGSSTTIAHETYGLQGQLVGKSVTLTHLHAGLMGTFEGNTTAVVANGAYQYSVAAVMARVGGGALLTATKPICGFAAVLNGASIASGISAAFAACGTSTGTWTTLLAADKCDYVFYAATGTNNENGCKLATVTLGGTGDGTLRIKINTTEYFIPFYAAGSISGE